jgi:enoyl-CoA hydratase
MTDTPIRSANPNGDVTARRDGSCVTVTIDRPGKRNALSSHIQDRLAATFDDLAADESIGLVVLTGSGDRAFAAGGDLVALSEVRTADGAREMALRARSVLDRVRRFPAVVVAALNGDAIGGGAELAMACDLRVTASHARMGFAQGRQAVTSAWGGGVDLMHLVGTARALRLLSTCEFVSHAHGLAIGLYDHCAADGEPLDAAVSEFIAPMLDRSPQVLRTYKAMAIANRMIASRTELEEVEVDCFVDNWMHADHWDALEAFLQRPRV